MANAVHRKILVALAQFNFNTNFAALDGLPDADLAWSVPVTTCEDCDFVEVFAAIKTGTSPTAGKTIQFYAGRGDDGGTEKRVGTDDIVTTNFGTEGTAADITRILGVLGPPQGVISVDATSDKVYTVQFRIWYPGADFNLFVLNDTGAALNAIGSPHSISFRGWGVELQ